MSRRREKARTRRDRPQGAAPEGARGQAPEGARGPAADGARDPAAARAPGRKPPRIPFLTQAAILIGVFAVVSLIADLAGAANLGVALGVGDIAFAIALVAMIVKA